jgi:hypothetical protein
VGNTLRLRTSSQGSRRLLYICCVAAIQVIAVLQPAMGQDGRPAYQLMRYDEDWSSLSDTSRRSDWLDSLKYISLGQPGWYVTLGGEIREKFELLDQPGFGKGPEDQTGYLLQRYLLSSDFHFGNRFRFYTEFQSGLEDGRNGGPRPTDLDRLDLHQAFLDWRVSGGESEGITLRLGRQEFVFGSGRLIAPAEGLNLRRSLDGVRINIKKGKVNFNASAERLVLSTPGVFDDVPNHAQTFWGAGFVMPRPFWKVSNIGAYYLGFDNKQSVFAKGIGREIRETFGAHIWKRTGPWDYDDEGLFQTGSFRGAPIRAWALSEDGGYTFSRLPLLPRLGIRADATSGDKGPAHHALGSFDPLFSAVPVWSGPSALLGGTNLIDVTPSIRLKFTPVFGVTLESSTFWRESRFDSVYTAFNTPLRPANPNASRYLATAPSATFAWQATRHTFYSIIYTHFFTGDFFQTERPGRNVNYLGAWISYRF